MRSLSAVFIIASLILLTGLSSIGRSAHPGLPTVGDGLQTAGPGLPTLPFGDDAGGSH